MRMRTTQSVCERERVSEDEKRLCHFLPCRFLPSFVHFFSLVMVGVDVVVVAVVTTRCHLFRLHPFKMLMHEFTSSIAFSQRLCVCVEDYGGGAFFHISYLRCYLSKIDS